MGYSSLRRVDTIVPLLTTNIIGETLFCLFKPLGWLCYLSVKCCPPIIQLLVDNAYKADRRLSLLPFIVVEAVIGLQDLALRDAGKIFSRRFVQKPQMDRGLLSNVIISAKT